FPSLSEKLDGNSPASGLMSTLRINLITIVSFTKIAKYSALHLSLNLKTQNSFNACDDAQAGRYLFF
ncbi:MAG: hypothetical protein MJY70_05615, partial [Bacteroidales bacterium]|nr:hypothetical protein [Bacteroidales bacterium]